MTTMKPEFSAEDIKAYTPSEKVGLLACVNPQGLPHISLITSMQANGPKELIAGEFVTGASKKFIQLNPRAAFLIMTFDRSLWRGRITWTHLAKEGPEYELMNLIPMFRYNTYFGINTVHYFDLLEVSPRQALPMNAIIREAVKTMLGKRLLKVRSKERILKPFIEDMFNGLSNLKFLAYIRPDGYPAIIPIIQCQAVGSARLAFSTGVYPAELKDIPAGAPVAVFCMNFGIEDVLIRGTFSRTRKSLGMEMGMVDIDWVYNSMPPAVGQVYPQAALTPVTNFE